MLLPQLGNDINGLHTSIFRKSEWDNLERLRKCLHTVRIHPRHFHGGILESEASLNLRRATSGNQRALLDQTPNDALRIVDRSVGFLENEVVRATEQDRHGMARILHPGELDDLVPASGHDYVADVFGAPQLIGRHTVGMSDGGTTQSSADEFDVGTFNVGYHQNAHLGQKVQRKFVVGISKDRLLDENYIGTALFDLLALAEDVLPLVAENTVHGGIVTNHDIVVHVGLGRRQAELNEGNLGIGNLGRSAGALGAALVENKSVYQLGIINRTSHLLDHAYVPKVDVGRRIPAIAQETQDGIDGDGS
mmetsp:Transcript_37990/g.82658  ORF Transcript_37990/g.82658 Transcript_37990/m.82658 type:complete len:307 (+) Transcript_37990:263-1183(+)